MFLPLGRIVMISNLRFDLLIVLIRSTICKTKKVNMINKTLTGTPNESQDWLSKAGRTAVSYGHPWDQGPLKTG